MPIVFLSTALLIVSLATNLTVEAIKKVLNGTSVKYSSNLLAVIASIVLACAVSAGYLILNGIPFDLTVGVQVIALIYLSFLVSTVGYDKVLQMLGQISK